MGIKPPLGADRIEEQLDESLFAVLSSRRTAAEPARRLAELPRPKQDFVLRWTGVIARSSAEIAYQFATHAREAFHALEAEEHVEAWLIHAMDVYDRFGLYPAVQIVQDSAAFAELVAAKRSSVALEDITGVLARFVLGLSGRNLKLEEGAQSYTDTETLFLPGSVGRLSSPDANYRLYKATAVYLWAQTRFGTWRWSLTQALAPFDDKERATQVFHTLERLRLCACIGRELPGIHRDFVALCDMLNEAICPPGWEAHEEALSKPEASVADTYERVSPIYASRMHVPGTLAFQGTMFPERVEEIMGRRLSRERDEFRSVLAKLKSEHAGPEDREDPATGRFSVRLREPEPGTHNIELDLLLDDQPLPVPDDVRGLMASIMQDLGEIPDQYLQPAGEGAYSREATEVRNPAADVWKGTYHEKGAHLYDEWDFRRQHYRKGWCVLRELDVHPRPGVFVERTRRKYARHITELRKIFEALRGEDRHIGKQPAGDDIDIDALVEAYADAKSGLEMSERLFVKLHKVERNIAVMFMVDMSGSTKGWINEAERESLVLLCEALEVLGDRYAIYGFSGMSRKRCEVYRIKRFDEAYDDEVRARITGISPRDYTRMGVAIRHLARLLNQVEARTRLLVTLSDGKPDDYGADYRGEHGIEDTRQALIEAKRDGIHPFCITIDREAADYLPHMYGPVNYAIVNAVEKLPLKVSDIYRRLTT